MNTLDTIIAEDHTDLQILIYGHIQKYGIDCNLNHIDVSKVTDFSYLFKGSLFNGDVSLWDTSNATTMVGMFQGSSFNGDISNWNTSKVEYMSNMFSGSFFNKDIHGWDVSNVINMSFMFDKSQFNQPLENWNVSNVASMSFMFWKSNYEHDLSKWNVYEYCDVLQMFTGCTYPKDGILFWHFSYINEIKNLDQSKLEHLNKLKPILESLNLSDIQAAKYLYDTYHNPNIFDNLSFNHV